GVGGRIIRDGGGGGQLGDPREACVQRGPGVEERTLPIEFVRSTLVKPLLIVPDKALEPTRVILGGPAVGPAGGAARTPGTPGAVGAGQDGGIQKCVLRPDPHIP